LIANDAGGLDGEFQSREGNVGCSAPRSVAEFYDRGSVVDFAVGHGGRSGSVDTTDTTRFRSDPSGIIDNAVPNRPAEAAAGHS
jgi:hypothetical protein